METNLTKTIVIDRSKWRCGGTRVSSGKYIRGDGITKLLNEQGFMCCLGFAVKQLGGDNLNIFNKSTPDALSCKSPIYPLTEFGEPDYGEPFLEDTKFTETAIAINDNYLISDEERETKLEELASQYGLHFEFVGEYNGA